MAHVASAPRDGPCKLPRTGRSANAFPSPVVQPGGDAQLVRPPAPSTPRAHSRFRAPHPPSLPSPAAPPARPASSLPLPPARAASSGGPRPAGGLGPSGAGAAARHRRHPRLSPFAEWNEPQAPFRLVGNTYYVGTRGLAALLVTTARGHVLVDAGLPESAPLIARNIETLGFRLRDVRLIVNSHVHVDHAGGIAALQRMSGAEVVASASSARVLRTGEAGRDDPQYGERRLLVPVARVQEIAAGDTVRSGGVVFTALRTAGHPPGGDELALGVARGATALDDRVRRFADGDLGRRLPLHRQPAPSQCAGGPCRRARRPRADAVRRAGHAELRHRGRLRRLALAMVLAIELAAQRARQRVAREGLGHEGT